jgi:hypothetical protein
MKAISKFIKEIFDGRGVFGSQGIGDDMPWHVVLGKIVVATALIIAFIYFLTDQRLFKYILEPTAFILGCILLVLIFAMIIFIILKISSMNYEEWKKFYRGFKTWRYRLLNAKKPFNTIKSMLLIFIAVYIIYFVTILTIINSIPYTAFFIYEYLYIPLYNILSFYIPDMTDNKIYRLFMYTSLMSILLAVVIRGKYRTVGLFLLFLGTMFIMLAESSDTMRSNISWAQLDLYRAGLHSGPFDGTMESNTRGALRKYQESKGLPVTGKLNKVTQEVMRKDTFIQQSELPLPEGFSRTPGGYILNHNLGN